MDNKLSELSKPVAYSLRFRNVNGEPDKTINACTTFSTLEKAKAYGLGIRYVTKDDGKIVSVRDPSQDPIVEPLYSQEYVSALLSQIEADREIKARLCRESNSLHDRLKAAEKRIAELEAGLLNSHHRLMNTTQNCSEWERKAISNFDECANMSQRIEELEAKLATPVRLPELCGDGDNDTEYTEGLNDGITQSAIYLRRQGFKVEGDE